ncbi:cytochrome c biogenesis protein CcdC [Peribacillus asahii]|uniref:Cytochrome c biogenesis protein CcdC n=1 Tax=Peribacillus asahii TaxID=228899 RepID=A0A398BDL2_9BACI|nr:cytochrome c biogenesis protein CcdC [Peribacillus asahii]RID86908.1 cytochrome c biogenesis protein CcdC [Peribacillus asahii]
MVIYISAVIAIIMGITVYKFRMTETERPVNVKKIILPPLFMSTGALMFIFPMFRITSYEFIEAFTVGLLFSILLIKTSKFEVRDNQIYMQRSKAFVFILVALLLIRVVAKIILGSTLEFGVLAGMFYILALGMIVPWRIAMYFQYQKVKESQLGNGKMA